LSFEKVDQYIRELEAVKNYERVKAENASLTARVKELESRLASEAGRVEELLQKVKELEDVVEARNDEIESLRKELSVRDGRIKGLEDEVERLNSRVKELEELKVLAEGKTLKEAEEAFLKAVESEVRERAQELLNQLKSEWEGKEKPREVLNEALKWLKHVIDQLSKQGPRNFAKEVADSGLPEKVEEVIKSGVGRRINEEFVRRVEEESSKKALQKLEELKTVELPRWYKSVVEPRIRQLESAIQSNVMKTLEGSWIITCDKCGTKFQIQLTPEWVEELLRTGNIMIECPNPNCVDTFLAFTSKHKVKVTLKQLIELKCVG